MLDITFLTSNLTKLAHARYIADNEQIRVIGFRQRTYHANYYEPRISSRAELLRRSYDSALLQCQKASIPVHQQFFILEDTSVRIHALSTTKLDIPGIDVKYWMERTSFSQLDGMLKRAGNDRRAQVRSDVLLHIPKTKRPALRIDGDYCLFTGTQDGNIVDEEIEFETNAVFPWLDNQTFNKWFQPLGFAQPFGSLDVASADRVDFRRKAFEKMFAFLSRHNLLEEQPHQMSFSLDTEQHFILCGHTCAGKTTASQHLAEHYGHLHIEASDFMYLNYYRRHGFRPNVSISNFAEQALRQVPHIVAEKIAEYILEETPAAVVISGFRSSEEIESLLARLNFTGMQFRLIFIEADQSIRFQRIQIRNRVGDKISSDEFQARDRQQTQMGLAGVYDLEGVTTWENNDTLDVYLRLVESHVTMMRMPETTIEASIARLRDTEDVGLEDAILIALLSVWTNDENRAYYSTPEIASIINGDVFPSIRPKHRENIHRYFNRDFYVHYEIAARGRGQTRVYRLSNTGYGRALRSLRKSVAALAGHAD